MFTVLGLYSRTKLCFCLNLCRPPGTYSIRPIEKLLNCQQRDDVRWVLLQATKNSAVALGSRNNTISIHQWSARTNEGKTTLIYLKVTRELFHEWFHHFRHHVHDGHWTGDFPTVIWRLHCFTVSFRERIRRRIRPQITRLSQLENYAMGYYTRLVRKMAWYKILIHVLIV